MARNVCIYYIGRTVACMAACRRLSAWKHPTMVSPRALRRMSKSRRTIDSSHRRLTICSMQSQSKAALAVYPARSVGLHMRGYHRLFLSL